MTRVRVRRPGRPRVSVHRCLTVCATAAIAAIAFSLAWCPSGSKLPGNVNASCKAASKNTQCAETPLAWPDICPAEPVDVCAAYSANCTSCASAPAEYNCGQSSGFIALPVCTLLHRWMIVFSSFSFFVFSHFFFLFSSSFSFLLFLCFPSRSVLL